MKALRLMVVLPCGHFHSVQHTTETDMPVDRRIMECSLALVDWQTNHECPEYSGESLKAQNEALRRLVDKLSGLKGGEDE